MDLTIIVLSLILLLVLIYLVERSESKRRIKYYMSKLPGPPIYPIIGSFLGSIGLSREEHIKYRMDQMKQYGPIYKTQLCGHYSVQIKKPEHFEAVLRHPRLLKKSSHYNVFKPWLGDGLFLNEGEEWRRHRKLITPTFHFKVLENFVEVFDEKASSFVEILAKEANGKVFDMYPYITRCTLDIICETAMGARCDSKSKEYTDFVDATYALSHISIQRVLKPWLRSDFIFHRTVMGRRFNQCLKIVHGFADKVINARLEKPTNVKMLTEDEEQLGSKQRIAFLDLLLEGYRNGDGLSIEDIRDEVDTFMFAGHDTTAGGLAWCLFLLGNHPDIQEKVRNEINEIFEVKTDDKLRMADLNEMKYLELVIKETLRLFPSAPIISRYISEDVQIGKYVVPKGVSVTLNIFDLHRDGGIYKNPNEFDPHRFLPENSKNRHAYSFVPFSAGPRNCIGQKFAMLEEKALLAKIIRNYKIRSTETIDTVKMAMEMILRPSKGLKLILEPINNGSY